jgi:hypothetical protein
MTDPVDWTRAFARQADVDLRAWELYEKHPEAVAAECHKLLFLQMACEKLCKAYLIQDGASSEDIQTSHGYIANPLPNVIKAQLVHLGRGSDKMSRLIIDHVHRLAREIEVLNPAMKRGGKRPDNCEYPWESDDRIMSPLDWSFQPSRLYEAPAGRTFLKLLRGAIDRILE